MPSIEQYLDKYPALRSYTIRIMRDKTGQFPADVSIASRMPTYVKYKHIPLRKSRTTGRREFMRRIHWSVYNRRWWAGVG